MSPHQLRPGSCCAWPRDMHSSPVFMSFQVPIWIGAINRHRPAGSRRLETREIRLACSCSDSNKIRPIAMAPSFLQPKKSLSCTLDHRTGMVGKRDGNSVISVTELSTVQSCSPAVGRTRAIGYRPPHASAMTVAPLQSVRLHWSTTCVPIGDVSRPRKNACAHASYALAESIILGFPKYY